VLQHFHSGLLASQLPTPFVQRERSRLPGAEGLDRPGRRGEDPASAAGAWSVGTV